MYTATRVFIMICTKPLPPLPVFEEVDGIGESGFNRLPDDLCRTWD
ncbi:hypothetical protein ACFL6O_05225 [candidate division KSB1 bacterium]